MTPLEKFLALPPETIKPVMPEGWRFGTDFTQQDRPEHWHRADRESVMYSTTDYADTLDLQALKGNLAEWAAQSSWYVGPDPLGEHPWFSENCDEPYQRHEAETYLDALLAAYVEVMS